MSLYLAHTIVGDPAGSQGTAFVLHGILGSARNWRAFARRLAGVWPGWRLVLVDLRGHGDSHPALPPNTLAAAAADLDRLAAQIGRPEVVVGHSFGGKLALTYARDSPEGLTAVWVLDALPGPGVAASDVALLLRALRDVPLPLARREELRVRMLGLGFSELLAGWMTTNLRRGAGEGLVWRFDLDAVEALLEDYLAVDLWPTVEDPPCALRFVRAERSERWTERALARFRGLPGVSVQLLEDAGHWVHVENPAGLLRILATGR